MEILTIIQNTASAATAGIVIGAIVAVASVGLVGFMENPNSTKTILG